MQVSVSLNQMILQVHWCFFFVFASLYWISQWFTNQWTNPRDAIPQYPFQVSGTDDVSYRNMLGYEWLKCPRLQRHSQHQPIYGSNTKEDPPKEEILSFLRFPKDPKNRLILSNCTIKIPEIWVYPLEMYPFWKIAGDDSYSGNFSLFLLLKFRLETVCLRIEYWDELFSYIMWKQQSDEY